MSVFTRKLTSSRFDALLGERVLYSAALLVFAVTFARVPQIATNQSENLLGLAAGCGLALLMVTLGMVVRIAYPANAQTNA